MSASTRVPGLGLHRQDQPCSHSTRVPCSAVGLVAETDCGEQMKTAGSGPSKKRHPPAGGSQGPCARSSPALCQAPCEVLSGPRLIPSLEQPCEMWGVT